MKKRVFIFVLFFMMLFIPNKVLAEEWYKGQYGCSYSDINKLRALASAIKFEVKFLGNTRNDEYGIQITNVSNDLTIYFNDQKVNTTTVLSDLDPDTYYNFVIKPSDEHACKNVLEVPKKVTIPPHNYYYDEELCKGAEGLDVCDPNYDSKQITVYEYQKKINDYKNSINGKKNTTNNKFIEFSKKYWYVYVISVVVLALIVFLAVKKKER